MLVSVTRRYRRAAAMHSDYLDTQFGFILNGHMYAESLVSEAWRKINEVAEFCNAVVNAPGSYNATARAECHALLDRIARFEFEAHKANLI